MRRSGRNTDASTRSSRGATAGHARGSGRAVVHSNEYDELEDKYLRLKEEHMQLKKLSHDQDIKIRKMATKLVRLTADLKRLQDGQGLEVSFTAKKQGATCRDVDTERLIEDLRKQVADLRKKNEHLNAKLGAVRHRQMMEERHRGPYGDVASRTNSGLSASRRTSRSAVETHRGRSVSPIREDKFYPTTSGGDGSDVEVMHLDHRPASHGSSGEMNDDQVQQMGIYVLRNKLLEAEHALQNLQDEHQTLAEEKDRLEALVNADPATRMAGAAAASSARFNATVNSNLNTQEYELRLLRLQTELQTVQGQLTLMSNKYDRAHAHLEPLRENQERLLEENKQLMVDLRLERIKSTKVDQYQERIRALEDALEEADVMLSDERSAREAYAEENRKLLKTAFSAEADQAHADQMASLRAQVEAAKARDRESARQTQGLRRQIESLTLEVNQLKTNERRQMVKGLEDKGEADQMRRQLEAIRASGVDVADLQRALVMVRSRKKGNNAGLSDPDLSFLQPVGTTGTTGDADHDAIHARLIYDLRKTRELLDMQVKLNRDVKTARDELVSDLEHVRADYEEQLSVYAAQLDAKNDRIRVLEEQLSGFLYNAPGKRLQRQLESAVDVAAELRLADNENLFEVHIDKAEFISAAGLGNPEDGQYFVTFDVYDFETMVTPVMQGAAPLFNYTARYVVTTNNAFFEWMHQNTIVMEIHRARGMDFEQIGVGFASLEDVIRDSTGKPQSRVISLHGVSQSQPIGKLTYSLRVLRPMSEAIALYEKRQGILSVLDPARVVMDASRHQAQRAAAVAGTSMLSVRVLSLNGLPDTCRHPCVYHQLFTFNRHHTEILTAAASAESGVIEVNDEQVYPLPMTDDTHLYLSTRELDFVVVDADEADPTTFVGVASVPLFDLVRQDGAEQVVLTTAQLVTQRGTAAGNICVEISWESLDGGAQAYARHRQRYPVPPAPAPRLGSGSDKENHAAATPDNTAAVTHPLESTNAPTGETEAAAGESTKKRRKRRRRKKRADGTEDAPSQATQVTPLSPTADPVPSSSVQNPVVGQLAVHEAVTVVVNDLCFTQPGYAQHTLRHASDGTLADDISLMYAFMGEWMEVRPTSTTDTTLTYDHRKVFPCPRGSRARSLLAEALSEEALADPQSEKGLGALEFVFVDVNTQAEVGLTFVHFQGILDRGDDMINASLDVVALDPSTDDFVTVGQLGVTVLAVEAFLDALEEQIAE